MGRDGEGEVSLRATWDQGGQDSTTQKEGFQVSKGKGDKGESARGIKGECAITVIANLYICIIS
jgi:hypothetical protein